MFFNYQSLSAVTKEQLLTELKRFSYPCRYSDTIHRFARPVPEISMITNTVMDHIFLSHGHRISQWNFDILSPPMLQEYADVIHAKGVPLNNCFGFIDGTVRPISRPGQHQRIVYNGHKRVHSLKFQSVALPNGLVSSYKRMPYHSISPLIIFCHFLINSVTKPFSTKMTENNQSFFSFFSIFCLILPIQKNRIKICKL